ncbi:hypothetical protein [Roseivivax isoporae]|uniref:Uncharacterized protein n=1 Tax=Roseivivax isoporae LMG 25204 TaxID=1449351 RepID=X7FBI6_9RHOB|nr:hypothetical protein [Roseivivax isoporae]ETX29471.1 hypothetical protein RISW2_23330 [Roseivivax isoporae LMG 25204]
MAAANALTFLPGTGVAASMRRPAMRAWLRAAVATLFSVIAIRRDPHAMGAVR